MTKFYDFECLSLLVPRHHQHSPVASMRVCSDGQYSHIPITSQNYGQTHPIPALYISPAKYTHLLFLPKECFISGSKTELIMTKGQSCWKTEIHSPRNNKGKSIYFLPRVGGTDTDWSPCDHLMGRIFTGIFSLGIKTQRGNGSDVWDQISVPRTTNLFSAIRWWRLPVSPFLGTEGVYLRER